MKRLKYKVQFLPLEKIRPNSSQRPTDESGLKLLMHSIRNEGVNVPLVVTASEDGKSWIVKSGGHRRLACMRLKITVVPCCIVDKGQANARAVSDNLIKTRYSKLEQARDLVIYARRYLKDAPPVGGVQPNDKGISKVAKALGLPRKKISRAYGISEIPKSVQKLLQDKKLDNNIGLLHQLIGMNSEEGKKVITTWRFRNERL